jgi:mono/diheme cytochrome c family protein
MLQFMRKLLSLNFEVPVSRLALVLLLLFCLVLALPAQQNSTTQKTPAIASVPAKAAKAPNPVKSSPESLARATKWWSLDCAMCHGKDGDGKGLVARDMKLQMADFTDPATLKDSTDGELFYIIKNGHQDMPQEGTRVKTEENWDLVNYVRSLAKKKPEAEPKAQ